MNNRHEQSKRLIEVLRPQTIILLIALFNLVWVVVGIVRDWQTFSWREGDVHYVLFEPVLLLVAAFVLWPGKLLGHFIALIVAVLIFYELGVLGYLGTARAFGLPRFSYAAIAAYFAAWPSHPGYAVNVLVAFLITACALFLLSKGLYQRSQYSSGGI